MDAAVATEATLQESEVGNQVPGYPELKDDFKYF
jgi:hypothetical protein